MSGIFIEFFEERRKKTKLKKRLLFIEDLYDFYSTTYKRSTHFNAKDSGKPLVVQVHGKVNFDEVDKDKEGLLPVHLQACHTELNLNGSNIDESVMTSALPSFSNRPILGFIHKVVTDENPNGQWEFYSHNFHEENDEIVYDEIPVGIIPESCNAQLVYDEEKEKTYCEVDGYIFEEYSKAAEILQREKECFVSVEISIRELEYQAKEKYLNIKDFFFSGVTILGKTPESKAVMPGMKGANIKLADFSEKNNSLFLNYEEKITELQKRLENLESHFDNKNPKEGGNEKNMFEKLLEKYGKTIEDITFEYEGLSDEELEAKFSAEFEEGTSTSTSSDGEGSGEGTQQFENMRRSFELSHSDIRYALYELLKPFEDADNDWYWISSVYDSYFVYENYNDKIYRQNYTKDNDTNVVAFEGERSELFRELLTASEKAELESMRSNYAALKEFKENAEKNELHAQKEELINSEKYSILAEKNENGEYTNTAFAELVKNIDNYSLTDLETQIKVIHSDYISEHSNFSVNKPIENKTVSMKMFANPNTKKTKSSRYGDLFKK